MTNKERVRTVMVQCTRTVNPYSSDLSCCTYVSAAYLFYFVGASALDYKDFLSLFTFQMFVRNSRRYRVSNLAFLLRVDSTGCLYCVNDPRSVYFHVCNCTSND